MNRFEAIIAKHDLTLRRGRLQTLQVNVGRNVQSGVPPLPCGRCPLAQGNNARIGGATRGRVDSPAPSAGRGHHRRAPELSEHFRFLVETSRDAGCRVIDRNNPTMIETPAFAWSPEYLAAQEVEVVASLPCYLEENVNAQRGDGVFEKSIAALRKLNARPRAHS